jgi:DNA repair protein RadC
MNTSLPLNPLETASTVEILGELVGQPAASKLIGMYGSLSDLARAGETELTQLAGLTPKRARRIKSAMLLAQRLATDTPEAKPLLDTPERVADILRENCRGYQVETFHLLLLNARRRLIRVVKISEGTLDTLLIHARQIFRPAILWNASSVVLAHNHPSGDPTPSDADTKITRDLIRAGQLLKIEVVDHVIIGQKSTDRPQDFASMRALGFFYA